MPRSPRSTPPSPPRCATRARVAHPDQGGLDAGQLRVAVSLRAIGEGHVSSIGFCTAVIGPGPTWSFDHRELPVVTGEAAPAVWRKRQLRAVLADQGSIDELSTALLHSLPERFDALDLERSLAGVSGDLLARPGGPGAWTCCAGWSPRPIR